MSNKNKLLTVFSDAEQEALYGLPDFDDAQRLEYLALAESELAFASSRPSLQAQVYCVLQIGYFKAKHAFFRFDWHEVEDDCAFVLSRYFHGEAFERKAITKHEHYSQRGQIAELFGYRSWAASFLPQLAQQAEQIVRRDVMPGFVAAELIVWLSEHKIIRPGHTTLQELVSEALSTERRRLGGLLAEVLDESAKAALGQLLVRDDTLSQLAALKQDAKDFGWRQMAGEREKRATLKSLHGIAKALLPKLGISQQNLLYYASLANFYTVHDLRHLKAEQTRLYLLCYAWVRYRQLTDNLVDAMAFHMKKLEDESRTGAKQSFVAEQLRRHQETPQVGRLLSLYVDDSVADPTPFGEVRQRAYKIMSRELLQNTAQRMSVKPLNKLALHWQAVDGLAERIRRHLRPLYVALDFAGTAPDNPWLAALTWAKSVFAKQQRLSQRPLDECPAATLPKRLRPYLLMFDAEGTPTGLHADRYEFWLYRQVRKRFQAAGLFHPFAQVFQVLQQRKRIAQDQAVLINVGSRVATQHAMTPAQAHTFQRAVLYDVIQGDITFPLFRLGAVSTLHVCPLQVRNGSLQAGNADAAKVVAVLAKSGALAGTGEVGGQAISQQVGARAGRSFDAALVELHEVAVFGHTLIAEHHRMALQCVRERGAPSVVIDFARTVTERGAGRVATGTACSAAVLAIGRGAEIAQIGFQATSAQGQVMAQAGEVLFVVVIKIRVVILRRQILVDLPVPAREIELVRCLATAVNGQAGAVARCAADRVFELASGQRQVVNFVGGDHAAFEHLRQQAPIVRYENWQLRQQSADARLGLRETNLAGQAAFAEVVDRAAVALQRE